MTHDLILVQEMFRSARARAFAWAWTAEGVSRTPIVSASNESSVQPRTTPNSAAGSRSRARTMSAARCGFGAMRSSRPLTMVQPGRYRARASPWFPQAPTVHICWPSTHRSFARPSLRVWPHARAVDHERPAGACMNSLWCHSVSDSPSAGHWFCTLGRAMQVSR